MDSSEVKIDPEYLNNILSNQSYVGGYVINRVDLKAFEDIIINNLDQNQFPYMMRWYNHVKFLIADGIPVISSNKISKQVSSMNNVKPAKVKTCPENSNNQDMIKGIQGELAEKPIFIEERLQLWDKLHGEFRASLLTKTAENITITLPDGNVRSGMSWQTTPLDIAEGISKGLAEKTIVAKVNNELWDLKRPFECNSTLQLLNFEDTEAKSVFWHSSAHLLGECLERVYGAHLCFGPPIEEGFFYDIYMEDGSISMHDFPAIDDVCKKIIKEKQPFERLEMNKQDLLEMFKYNKFKQRIINEKVQTDKTTVYRCGTLIDLCRGPHVRHTGNIKALMATKSSCSYWGGNKDNESLQRLYGMSFPDPKQLREWKHFQDEAAKRDHRKLGVKQQLFFFNEMSPGSCFFLPNGTFIYNTLIDFLKQEYRKRGFDEVITPNLYKTKLWETSGHWEHYEDNMFNFELENDRYAMKPMNCPGHCIMFAQKTRSWKELPVRMADFGVLHRNEYSGALSGLTRVRRFQQDDAHIFCSSDMIKDEIKGALDFLSAVYETFGFEFQLVLSTRPEKYMGEVAMWDMAEKQLEQSLDEFGKPWKMNPGDGAFYGPKIDITVTDALRRRHQCATIQLDFQLPLRFELTYANEKGELVTPVIIHRAILGSVERMIAILTESYGGKWPFWLSPRQVQIISVMPMFNEYAKEVHAALHEANIQVDVEFDPTVTLNKKIREGQLDQYNFILVVGEKEKDNKTINVRTRSGKIFGEYSVADFIKRLERLKKSRTLNFVEDF